MIKTCMFCKEEFKTRSSKRRYCSTSCYWLSQFGRKRNMDCHGRNNANWRGGRRIDKSGYVLIHTPGHPYCDHAGYVREHRLVVEQHIGRYLLPSEVVHHINKITSDNRIENLEYMLKEEHDRISALTRIAEGYQLPRRVSVGGKLCFVR